CLCNNLIYTVYREVISHRFHLHIYDQSLVPSPIVCDGIYCFSCNNQFFRIIYCTTNKTIMDLLCKRRCMDDYVRFSRRGPRTNRSNRPAVGNYCASQSGLCAVNRAYTVHLDSGYIIAIHWMEMERKTIICLM